jgi:hypothetical protein
MQLTSRFTSRFTHLYMERHRKDRPIAVDEDALVHMDHLILEFDDYFQRIVAPAMASGGETIKYHKGIHFTQMIRCISYCSRTSQYFLHAMRKEL